MLRPVQCCAFVTLGVGVFVSAETDDPRHVVVESFSIVVDGRDPIVLKLSTEEEQKSAADRRLVFKEGQTYRTRVQFRVQHDVVLGLKFTNSVYKMKMRGAGFCSCLGPRCLSSCCWVQWIVPKQ